jgi:hypothetical protein
VYRLRGVLFRVFVWHTRLAYRRLARRVAADVAAECPLELIDRATVNERAVAACRTAGEGLFTRVLRDELRRRRLEVPFVEYDLIAEMRGDGQSHVVRPLLGDRPVRP